MSREEERTIGTSYGWEKVRLELVAQQRSYPFDAAAVATPHARGGQVSAAFGDMMPFR